LGTGTIPTEGEGTRLMWYPAKAAFRAGQVGRFSDGTEWNADNVGDYSTAFGFNTTASGEASTAMGDGAQASGYASTAMGEISQASGYASTAMGFGTQASGYASTAIGFGTQASGYVSTAIGFETQASGDRSTAIGFETIAANENSVTVGRCNDRNSSSGGSALFVVGNGRISTGSCQRGLPAADLSDAFVVEEDGRAIASRFDTFSDRRLKTGIEPLEENTLQALTNLRPVRYRFKNQQTHPSGEQIGLIAQEVRKAFPALVREDPSGTLSLAYPKLTAVLLKGLQEQQAQIDSLRQRTKRVDAIEDRLAALEADQTPDERPADNEQHASEEQPASEEQQAARWAAGLPVRSLALVLIGMGLGATILHVRRR
jgi:hypothetical protein